MVLTCEMLQVGVKHRPFELALRDKKMSLECASMFDEELSDAHLLPPEIPE